VETLGPALTRWVLYSAVSVLVGTALFHWLVLTRCVSPSLERKARIRRSVGRGAVGAGIALVLSVPGTLWFQFRDFHDPIFDPWQSSLDVLLTESLWGRIWTVQMLLALLTAGAAILARRRPTGGGSWVTFTALAFASAAMPAFSGHSFGAERLQTLSVVMDVLHLWAAGGWIGLLAVLFLAARRHLDRDPESMGALEEWVRAFSTTALVSFTVLLLTGTFAAWLQVESLELLFGSRYGRILLLKLAVLAGVAGLGFYNWRRMTPVLGSPEGERRFLGFSAPLEIALGFLILLVTGFLVHTNLPVEGLPG